MGLTSATVFPHVSPIAHDENSIFESMYIVHLKILGGRAGEPEPELEPGVFGSLEPEL